MEWTEKCVLGFPKIVEFRYKLHELSLMVLSLILSELTFPQVRILYILSLSDWSNHDESMLLRDQ